MQDAQKRPEGPQKVIVFSTFVQALHLMADTLAKNKLGFVMLHGQMTLEERSQVHSQTPAPYICLYPNGMLKKATCEQNLKLFALL